MKRDARSSKVHVINLKGHLDSKADHEKAIYIPGIHPVPAIWMQHHDIPS